MGEPTSNPDIGAPQMFPSTAEARRAFACPGCAREVEVSDDGPFQCPICGRKGEYYRFDPVLPKVEHAAHAMPDDAVCAHHPSKRADAICAGTGDYICSLCAVELNGKTYSVQYMSRGGKPLVSQAFQTRLPRPDRGVALCLVLSLLFWCVAPLTLGFAIYYLVKMIRDRRKDPLYASIVGRGTAVTYFILVSLMALGGLVLGVVFIVHAAGG